MQKVLIVGQTQKLGRTEDVYGRGFSDVGCEVEYFNLQDADPSLRSPSLSDRLAWRFAWQFMAQSANQKLLKAAENFKPDLIFVISPHLVQPQSIKALQKYGLVFVFFTDNPLDSHHTHTNTWIKQGLTIWDAVFIWSQELVIQLQNKGVKKVFFHPFCSDVSYHFPKKQLSPIYDVAFIGNWDASRKREKYLMAIADCRLGIWGTDYWLTRCKEGSLNCFVKGMCEYIQMPDVLGSAKMGLNILRPQNEMGHNIRTFEIPASGTMMLSERSQDLLNLFEEDKEVVYFSSPEELHQKVNYLLQNDHLINSIAEAGYKKSMQHTIKDRILDVLSVVKQI
jgi:spore maturation protein CgeB